MIRFKILLLIFVMQFSLGCDNKQRNTEIPKKIDTLNVSNLIFEKNLKEKPKLFLKFWSGMTHKEFEKVVTILIDENVLSATESYQPSENTPIKYYSNIIFHASDNSYINLYGDFDNDKLRSIKMYDINCLYDLYNEKYKLPPLEYKLLIDSEYIENNPKYQPVFFYTDDNNNYVQLPDAFYDKRSSLKQGRIYKNRKFIGKEKTPMLARSPLGVIKDSVMITFEHVKKNYETQRYSLEESEKIINYLKTDEGQKMLWNESRFIYTNSVLRTVSLESRYSFNAIYMSLNDYNKELNKIKTTKKDSLEKEKIKKEKIKNTFKNI